MSVKILYLHIGIRIIYFFLFWQEDRKIRPEHLRLDMITRESVSCFLDWLEKSRGCCISTRNQRLAAIHSFIRYVQLESPENLFELQKVLAVPIKKSPRPDIKFLTLKETEILLAHRTSPLKWGEEILFCWPLCMIVAQESKK